MKNFIKQNPKIMINILMYLTFILSVGAFSVSKTDEVYAESAIYFDEDGNFVFSTYDRIATGNILYKTVGWIIKKYEEPVGNLGQISVVIPTPNYSYEIKDKDNPGYKYSYFVMDGEKVLEYISSVSKEWGDYLKKYGGTVYLDSIMTILEYGELKGGVNNDGSRYGETYSDYDGISNARGWADPYCLLDYFDIPVAFPAFVEEPEMKITTATKKISIGNSVMASAGMGSHKVNEEEYDIALGIPSGEDIYVYGQTDEYYVDGVIIENTGVVSVPVKVTTDYVLKWTDYDGTKRSERVQVDRYYYVNKNIKYYTAGDITLYTLDGINIDGECIENAQCAVSAEKLKSSSKSYGAVEKHIKVTAGSVYAGEKIITSQNNRKPDIPDENQEAAAKGADIEIKVRNDSLSIGGSVILNDEWTVSAGYKSFVSSKESFYKTDIIINDDAANGQYDDITAKLVYSSGTDKINVYANAGTLTVHTPIVCSVGVSAPKKYNMAVKPAANQLAVGTDFFITCKTIGSHRDIKGYGSRDYSMYMGEGYVLFPFDVIIDNKKYTKNTWIEIGVTGQVCYIPESVPLGNYEIKYAAVAKNGVINDISDAIDNGIIGDGANLSLFEYGAVSTVDVEVIGTISGFSVQTDEKTAYVGKYIGFNKKAPEGAEVMPLVLEDASSSYTLKVTSCGIGASADDSITADITYYYMKNGERSEVDLYIVGKHDIVGTTSYERLSDRVIFGEDEKRQVSDGVYEWEKDIELGEYLVVMPKGVEPENEKIVNQYALRGGNILINYDINGYSGNNRGYSYINVENFPKGYCNMWKTEGFLYDFVDKAGAEYGLSDGDSIIIGISGAIYEDYEVVGTH